MTAAFFRVFFWASLMNACGWDWCTSLQGAEWWGHATSSRCLLSGCVLCPPGSKRKWERIPSQSVWKMTHRIIFCISNITLAFLPMYQYSQALAPAASLVYFYLYISCVMPQSIHLPIFYILFSFTFSHFFSQAGTERPKLQLTQCNSCNHNVPRAQLTPSLVIVILLISGPNETGQKSSGVLGSLWPVWGRKMQLAWGMFLHREGTHGSQKQCSKGWNRRCLCSSPLRSVDTLQNPAQLWSLSPVIFLGREEGNRLRSRSAKLMPLL